MKTFKKIIMWLKGYRELKNFEAFKKQLELTAEANWKSNFAPRDFSNYETYREFFIGSHMLSLKVGADIKD